jgi:hypothetical protein
MHTPRSYRFGGAFLTLAALLVGGCSHDPTPVLPDGAVAFTAPTTYLTWWDRTSQCSELSGSMAKVEWYVVPDVRHISYRAGREGGHPGEDGRSHPDRACGPVPDARDGGAPRNAPRALQEPGHPDVYFTERCRLTWATWQEDNSGDVVGAATAIALN